MPFPSPGQLAQPYKAKQELLYVKLKKGDQNKGDGEQDGGVGEDVVEDEGVGDGDGVAGEGEEPVHHGHVDEVAGLGEVGQRHPAGPGKYVA